LSAATVLGNTVDVMAMSLDDDQALPSELYAAAKLLASEALWKAADAAVQLLGGRGYCESNIASQLLRDARITRIFEGPSETLANFIGQRFWQNNGNHLDGYFLQKGSAGRRAQSRLHQLL